ncbi:MAG: hypothetical protein AMXMBFR64_21180 [Myxococcales bacterium]
MSSSSSAASWLSRTLPPSIRETTARVADRLAWQALVLLAFVLPFDVGGGSTQLVSSPLRVCSLAVAVLAVISHALARPARRHLPAFEIALPAMVLACIALLSAAVAGDHQRASVLQALHFVEGVGVMAAVSVVIRGRQRREVLLTALLAGAAAFAAIGLVEVAAGHGLETLLGAFRNTGGSPIPPLELRATLDSGALAAVLLVPATALAAAWYLAARDRTTATGAFLLICVFAAAAIRTLSAVAWVALAVSALIVCLLVVEASPWRRGAIAVTLPMLAALLLVADPEAASRPFVRPSLRIYGAIIQPSTSELAMRPGRSHRVPVVLTNSGTFPWGAVGELPVSVGVRWFDATSGDLVAETPVAGRLPAIPVGEQAATRIMVSAPEAPRPHILALDVVEDGRVWYERMTTSAAVFRCDPVANDLLDCSPGSEQDRLVVRRAAGLPPVPDPSDRRLRKAALLMVQESPLLGKGPDGFRHTYWRYAPMESRDPRARLDNLFLQITSELGLAGLAAVLWLITATLWRLWIGLHRCRSATDRLLSGVLLAAVAGLAIQSVGASFLHAGGLVHVAWLLIGLAASVDVPPPLVVTPLPTALDATQGGG